MLLHRVLGVLELVDKHGKTERVSATDADDHNSNAADRQPPAPDVEAYDDSAQLVLGGGGIFGSFDDMWAKRFAHAIAPVLSVPALAE